MRCNILQSRSFATGLDYVPHNILRDAFPPHLSRSGNPSKDLSRRHPGRDRPLIERGFDPFWNGHGADVAALADQVYHYPVPLAHLDLVQLQADEFRSSEAASEQHGQHRVVTPGTHTVTTSMLEYLRTLLGAQPVAGAKPELLDTLDPADPGRQLWTQQARVCGFVSQTTHGCKLLVDGVGGQMPRFQIHAITHDDDAAESQPRLGAVPGDELVDDVLVDSARGWRAEAIENRRFTMIQVWQPQHSATVIRFDFVFAHGDGLPCRTIGTTADRLGDASVSTKMGSGVLSAMA
jgi:hypothetical protein